MQIIFLMSKVLIILSLKNLLSLIGIFAEVLSFGKKSLIDLQEVLSLIDMSLKNSWLMKKNKEFAQRKTQKQIVDKQLIFSNPFLSDQVCSLRWISEQDFCSSFNHSVLHVWTHWVDESSSHEIFISPTRWSLSSEEHSHVKKFWAHYCLSSLGHCSYVRRILLNHTQRNLLRDLQNLQPQFQDS